MKLRNIAYPITIAIFATLVIPICVSAQEPPRIEPGSKTPHHRYQLVDVGTLGGPQSASYFGDAQSLNNRGAVVGQADTKTPDPNYPNFNPYIGFGGPDPFVLHAFEAQGGKLTDLGALPGANSTSVGWITESGASAGVSQDGSIDPLTGWPEAVAVYWKDGQIVNLGTLGGNESIATAINDRGQIVGAAANSIPDHLSSPLGVPSYGTQQRAFLWENGAMHDLGTLGGPDAVALLMNERGQVAGISYTSSIPNTSGIPTIDSFLWDKDGMTDLGSFGGTVTAPNWLNKKGQVVGFSNLSGDTTAHPFLWSKVDGLKDLGTLGGTFGSANWVNEAREIVGASTIPGDQLQFAFLWKDAVMTNLGTVAGDACSVAFHINSHRQIVGSSVSSDNCFGDSGHAFLWEDGGMIDLNIFIPPGVNLTLTQGAFINDRGEILATGVLPSGDFRTVLLIPCDPEHGDREACEDERTGAGVMREAPTSRISGATPRLPGRRPMSPFRFSRTVRRPGN